MADTSLEDAIKGCGKSMEKYAEAVSDTNRGTLLRGLYSPLLNFYNQIHSFIEKERAEKRLLPAGQKIYDPKQKYQIAGLAISNLIDILNPGMDMAKDWEKLAGKIRPEQMDYLLRQRTSQFLGMSTEVFNELLNAIEENPHGGIASRLNDIITEKVIGTTDRPGEFLQHLSGNKYKELFPQGKYSPNIWGRALMQHPKFRNRYEWKDPKHLMVTPHREEGLLYSVTKGRVPEQIQAAYDIQEAA